MQLLFIYLLILLFDLFPFLESPKKFPGSKPDWKGPTLRKVIKLFF